jgi:hypothetical protein
MRWTKVRKLVHNSFAESVRGRVKVNITNADPRGIPWQDSCKFSWITLDGKVIAEVAPHYLRRRISPQYLRRLRISLPGQEQEILVFEPQPGQNIPEGASVGTFMDLNEACWQYLHSSVNDSLQSPDAFVSSLAVLNAKVGRTRLKRAQKWDLHPLARAVLDFRLEAEQAAASRR